ncbi:MAG: hypothetical protein IJ840_03425 [Bacteroidales bacterium]|nr:hypothetical protein [Bacteroidales bacterium]
MGASGNLKSLTMDELASVIKTWPWFGAARMELCERMSKMGGKEWGKEQYSDAAMYISSRSIISDIVRSSRKEDYSDKDIQTLLKKLIAPAPAAETEAATSPAPTAPVSLYPDRERSVASLDLYPSGTQTQPYQRTVKVPGGDFFSQDEYKDVTLEEDNYFSRFKVTRSDEEDGRKWEDPELGFCTETLAWIYAEQGYYAEAKKIYSRLMLRYPEKIAYFASLIGKLEEEIKK